MSCLSITLGRASCSVHRRQCWWWHWQQLSCRHRSPAHPGLWLPCTASCIYRKSTSKHKSKVGRKRKSAHTLTEECWDPPWGLECVFLCSLQSLLPLPSLAHPVLDLPEQIWTVHQVLKADNWRGRMIHESYLFIQKPFEHVNLSDAFVCYLSTRSILLWTSIIEFNSLSGICRFLRMFRTFTFWLIVSGWLMSLTWTSRS